MMNNKNLKLLPKAEWKQMRAKCDDLERSQKIAKNQLGELYADNVQLRESNQIAQNGLKSKYISLQEELEEAKRRNDILEQERRKAEEDRRKAEEDRRKAEEERCKTQEDMKRLTTQMQDALQTTTAANTTVLKLSERLEEVLKKLGACNDNLPAPQSPSQISDSDIASQFTGLLENIKSWVDEEFHEPRSLQKLANFLTRRHPKVPLGCLDKHFESEHKRLAKNYVTSHRTLLCSLIYGHLQCSILDENVPWLAFDDQEANDVSRSLYSAMSSLLQDGHREKEAREKLHKQITIPAVQLARRLGLPYRIVLVRPQEKVVYETDMQRYIIEDLATQRSVSPANLGVVGSYGQIGEQRLMVYPGLQRCHDGYGRDVTLCKPMILVDLDAPLRPRSRLSY